MYSAAALVNSGFVLFFSPDIAYPPSINVTDVLNATATYCNHSAQFKINGRCVVSGYGISGLGDGTPQYWKDNVLNNLTEINGGIPPLFIPQTLFIAEMPSKAQTNATQAIWDPVRY